MKTPPAIITSLILILSVTACTPGFGGGGNLTPYPTLTTQPSPTVEASPSPTLSPTAGTPTIPPTPAPAEDTPPPPTTESPSPTPLACWGKGGYLEQESISSVELELPLEFNVYLPPCYYHYPEQHFPVLYLLHGLYYTQNQWVRLGVEETANELMGSGEIPPFIIVMPRDQDWSLPPDNKFGEALVYDLVLWIDNQYRTIPGHAYRAIGGLSRGGNWAINIGLQYWGMFGAFGAHSAPIFYSDGLKLAGWMDKIPPEEMPRIFLDIGANDKDGDFMFRFEEMLSERGIPHEWHLNHGTHNEAYWSSHLDQYLRWYSEPWGE